MERGNLNVDVKGGIQIVGTIRIRVPMQSSGADRPVLVRKLVKAKGAKGSSYPVLQMSQPRIGRN